MFEMNLLCFDIDKTFRVVDGRIGDSLEALAPLGTGMRKHAAAIA